MASNGYLSEDFFLEDGEEAPYALETDAELERDGLDSSTEDQDMASLLAAYKKSKFSSNSNKRPSTSRKLVGEGFKKRLLFENKETEVSPERLVVCQKHHHENLDQLMMFVERCIRNWTVVRNPIHHVVVI